MTVHRITLDDPPFAGHTGRGVRVAVVDSGIAPNHPHVGAVAPGMNLTGAGDDGDTADRIGHGTAVAAAIREKAPDAELVAVRIFDRELVTDAAMLARAIEWAAAHNCRVVNLSLGTANMQHQALFDEALRRATAASAMVVSACESNGVRWLPGSLRPALGVMGDANLPRDAIEFDDGYDGGTRVRASIYPRPIPGVPPERNLHGVSFAVANVSGFMARRFEIGGVTGPGGPTGVEP